MWESPSHHVPLHHFVSVCPTVLWNKMGPFSHFLRSSFISPVRSRVEKGGRVNDGGEKSSYRDKWCPKRR